MMKKIPTNDVMEFNIEVISEKIGDAIDKVTEELDLDKLNLVPEHIVGAVSENRVDVRFMVFDKNKDCKEMWKELGAKNFGKIEEESIEEHRKRNSVLEAERILTEIFAILLNLPDTNNKFGKEINKAIDKITKLKRILESIERQKGE